MRYFWRIVVEIWRAAKFELLPTFGSLLTIFLATLIPGIVWLTAKNLARVEFELRSNLTVSVFLKNEPARDAADSLKARFLGIRGVTGAEYVSKEEALERMKARFGGDVLEGLEENPLPSSFVLRVNESMLDPETSKGVVRELEAIPQTDEVVFAGEILQRLGSILKSIRALGLALTLLVAFTAIVIVANTVRVAIADRRRTVEIMQLVGATRGYILTPFVLLGGLLGFLGAVLSMVATSSIAEFVSIHLLPVTTLEAHEIAAFVLTGLLLGMVGALVAAQKHLKI